MKRLAIVAFASVPFAAVPAQADHHEEASAQSDEASSIAEVVKRDEQGRAIRIRVDGYEYDVCGEGSQDGCINPREAGLDFGGVPIDYWPGQEASDIEGPLPAEAPAGNDE